MKTKFNLDPEEPPELVLVPENTRDEMLLDLTLKGQKVASIRKKENNGGSWILRFESQTSPVSTDVEQPVTQPTFPSNTVQERAERITQHLSEREDQI